MVFECLKSGEELKSARERAGDGSRA